MPWVERRNDPQADRRLKSMAQSLTPPESHS